MHPRQAIAAAVALFALLFTGSARAWQETHQTGDDVEVRVDPNGVAAVHHQLRWRVVRGPVKWIDLQNVPSNVLLDPNVGVTTEAGRALTARLARRDETSIRIAIDEPRAVLRGNITFDVRWQVDLTSSGALARDGATWRLTYTAPAAVDGFDSAQTVIDLPAAPAEPRPILADTGEIDESAVATLRRDSTRDVLQLVRPHVARGESVTWTVRIDPRALATVADPRLRPPPEAQPPEEPNRIREASLAASLAGLALAFGLLVAHKAHAFVARCSAHGAQARGLLPLPPSARAALAGASLAAGVALEVCDEPTLGGLAIGVATLAAALRGARASPKPRAPGRWLVLRPEEAFASTVGPSHWLDVGTWPGRYTAMAAGVLVAGIALVAGRFDAQARWLVALDSAVLVPLFVTGCESHLPSIAEPFAVAWLAGAFRRLRAKAILRVAPWARIALGCPSVDELRLLVLPRAAMPGLVGIEIALARDSAPVGWVATPEILVRVVEESAAAAKLARIAPPETRIVPGRRTDERVLRLVPSAPSVASAVRLAGALADALTDRRAALAAPPSTAIERRVGPSARTFRPSPGAGREIELLA